MEHRFEKVNYRPGEGARPRVIFMENVRDITVAGAPAITGTEVDREGEEVSGSGFDTRTRIIQSALVVRRTPMVMDNTYGVLVPA